jgi:hypothetical protein
MARWFESLRIEADLASVLYRQCKGFTLIRRTAPALSGMHARHLRKMRRGLMKPTTRGLDEDEVSFLEQRCSEIEVALATF